MTCFLGGVAVREQEGALTAVVLPATGVESVGFLVQLASDLLFGSYHCW